MLLKPLEQKLQKLHDKKKKLDDEIRQIEKQREQELRQLRQKKYTLIGKVLLSKIEAGETILINSEEDLLTVLDQNLITKTERKVFGLSYPATSDKTPSTKQPNTKENLPKKEKQTLNQQSAASTSDSTPKTSSKTRRKKPSSKTLPAAAPQDTLAQEFNL